LKEIDKYFLHPSKLVVSDRPLWVNTVLGSCVAVCVHDPKLNVGGINHFMLPLWNGDGLESPRYGNIAIPLLIERLLKFGSKKHDLVAKVFGGGNVLGESVSFFRVGERNVTIAMRLLEENKITVVASSTGGDRGRKIIFNTGTGEVLQQYIQKRTIG
jgi:chemotaxis protein CheD